jgi:hypothetical protein
MFSLLSAGDVVGWRHLLGKCQIVSGISRASICPNGYNWSLWTFVYLAAQVVSLAISVS